MTKTHIIPNSRSRVFMLDGVQRAEISSEDFRMSVDYSKASEIIATVKMPGSSSSMAICTFNIESFFQAFFLSLGEFSFLSMTYDEAVTGIMSRVGHPTDLSQGPAISKVSTMAKIESAKKQLALIERHRKLLREIDNALAAKAADLKSSRFNARHNLIERD